MARIVIWLIPLALLALSIWMWAVLIPRQRRYFREHPERRPYGWKLVLRMSPFVVIVVIGGVVGAIHHDWTWAVIGLVGTAAFIWDLRKRWHPPDAPEERPVTHQPPS